MSDVNFVDDATESELRDFAAKTVKQAKKARLAKIKFEKASTAAKEAKAKADRLNDEKDELIDNLEPDADRDAIAAVCAKREEERKAIEDHKSKNTKKLEAKHNLDEENDVLLEIIDEANDDQMHMDFDKAEKARSDRKEEVKSNASIAADPETDIAWRAFPVKKLKQSKPVNEALAAANVTTLGDLDRLFAGENEDYPGGPATLPEWSENKAEKLFQKFKDYLTSVGVKISGESEQEPEPEKTDVKDGVRVRVLVIPEGRGFQVGDVATGIKEGSIVTINDDIGPILLAEDDYELLAEPEPEPEPVESA